MDAPRQPLALDEVAFDSRFVETLPGDPEPQNYRRQVSGAAYSRVAPTPVKAPELLAWSVEMAQVLGLDAARLAEDAGERDRWARVFGGNELLPGMAPHAMCYGGHQFGNWAGQLGDGRAINLGDVIDPHGARWTLQLKGAGPTPYSRTADGLAVLRSSVREFLCSEAMHHLGVPTTRALTLVGTGEQVMRDMFYDGNAALEPGAVVCRVAPSFLRLGNYQLPTSRGEIDLLRALVDYTIETHFPHLGPPGKDTYIRWFAEVCRLTAEMVVHWQRVGFVHGVMNTDNLSVLGLTIDYGPYGWLEDYDPDWTPNTTDANGRRYRFGNQPEIALWNLVQFGNAVYPLVEEVDPLQEALAGYRDHFERRWRETLVAKLGLRDYGGDADGALFEELFAVLRLTETDMTLFFRRLAAFASEAAEPQGDDRALLAPLLPAYYQPEELTGERLARIARWLRRYRTRLRADNRPDAERAAAMNAVNPKYVLRNYLAQLAIDRSEQGDHAMIHELLDLLRRPYDEQPQHEQHAARRPDWARQRAGCSMLSCSS